MEQTNKEFFAIRDEEGLLIPSTNLTPVDLRPATRQGVDLISKGVALEVKSPDDEVTAGNWWKAGNDILKAIDDELDPIIKAAHGVHKSLVAKKAAAREPIERVMRALKTKVADYRRAAEEERRKKELELQAAAKKIEEDKRLEEAAEMEKAGLSDVADAILDAPVDVAPIVLQEPPKIKGGITLRTKYSFRIVDPDKIPRSYLTPDLVMIGNVVRGSKGKIQIPGVEIFEEKV